MTVQVLEGDCREVLRDLPAKSIHCVVCSPPYFGLRDYGTGTWSGGDPACDHVVGEIRRGVNLAASAAYTMEARTTTQAVAFQPRFVRNGRGAPDDVAAALTAEAGTTGKGDSAQCVQIGWRVRRLMPVECERLQGAPDGYTDVTIRGKPAADGPRYKGLGNAYSANVIRWLGLRIAAVSRIP